MKIEAKRINEYQRSIWILVTDDGMHMLEVVNATLEGHCAGAAGDEEHVEGCSTPKSPKPLVLQQVQAE